MDDEARGSDQVGCVDGRDGICHVSNEAGAGHLQIVCLATAKNSTTGHACSISTIFEPTPPGFDPRTKSFQITTGRFILSMVISWSEQLPTSVRGPAARTPPWMGICKYAYVGNTQPRGLRFPGRSSSSLGGFLGPFIFSPRCLLPTSHGQITNDASSISNPFLTQLAVRQLGGNHGGRAAWLPVLVKTTLARGCCNLTRAGCTSSFSSRLNKTESRGAWHPQPPGGMPLHSSQSRPPRGSLSMPRCGFVRTRTQHVRVTGHPTPQ